MAFKAEIVAHSRSLDGFELLTFEVTYPRIVHSEMMTHRVFSRNSASTRAIPIINQLRNILQNPFVPEKFGINQPGMQAYRHLEGLKHEEAEEMWLRGRDRAVTTVIELILGEERAQKLLGYNSLEGYANGAAILEKLDELSKEMPKSTDKIDPDLTSMLNVHKQLAGRGLEAYMWHTVVITATEFDNFYALRDHPEAQGEIATIARMMHEAHKASTPKVLDYGEWHLPYVEEGEFDDIEEAIMASGARCAATSYNRQRNKNPEREFERYNDLVAQGHMSPFEHQGSPFSKLELEARKAAMSVARVRIEAVYRGFLKKDQTSERDAALKATEQMMFSGNFKGFTQHRKQIAYEANFGELL